MNYVESPVSQPTNQKHLQRGQIAILTDCVGHGTMLEFSSWLPDHDLFSMVANTILILDLEKWIRGLPASPGVEADQDTMRISPADGVHITFDRYVMTMDGFMLRKDLGQYKMDKLVGVYRKLAEEGKLFVAEVD